MQFGVFQFGGHAPALPEADGPSPALRVPSPSFSLSVDLSPFGLGINPFAFGRTLLLSRIGRPRMTLCPLTLFAL